MQNFRYLLSPRALAAGASYLNARERSIGSPIFFMIETVNVCNLRCIYCPQSRPREHFANGRGVMSTDQFARVVDNLCSAFDVRSVSLQRDGEPMLNRHIEECVAHLTARGIDASISSNCTLIDRARAERLIGAGLRSVKTDFCADPVTYEQLRAGGRYDDALGGIRALLDAAWRRGARFRVRITDLATHGLPPEESREAVRRTHALFARWADRLVVVPVRFHNALGGALVNLGGDPKPGDSGRYTLCHQPWLAMTVDFAGRVVCCCRDLRGEYVLGNLLEQPASEIWNGKPMRSLRRALAARRPEDNPVCASCDLPWRGSYSGRSRGGKFANFLFSRLYAN